MVLVLVLAVLVLVLMVVGVGVLMVLKCWVLPSRKRYCCMRGEGTQSL